MTEKEELKKELLKLYKNPHDGDEYIKYFQNVTRFLNKIYSHEFDFFSFPMNNIRKEYIAQFFYYLITNDKFTNLIIGKQKIKYNDEFSNLMYQLNENKIKSEEISQSLELKEVADKFKDLEVNIEKLKIFINDKINNEQTTDAIVEIISYYDAIFKDVNQYKSIFSLHGKYAINTNYLINFIFSGTIILESILKYAILFNPKFKLDKKISCINDIMSLVCNLNDKINIIFKPHIKKRMELKSKKNYTDEFVEFEGRSREIYIINEKKNVICNLLQEDAKEKGYYSYKGFPFLDIKTYDYTKEEIIKFINYNKNISNFEEKCKKLDDVITKTDLLEDNYFRNLTNLVEFKAAFTETYIDNVRYNPTIKKEAAIKYSKGNQKKGKTAKTIMNEIYINFKENNIYELLYADNDIDFIDKMQFLDLKITRGYFKEYGVMDCYNKYNKIIYKYCSNIVNFFKANDEDIIYDSVLLYTKSILLILSCLI